MGFGGFGHGHAFGELSWSPELRAAKGAEKLPHLHEMEQVNGTVGRGITDFPH